MFVVALLTLAVISPSMFAQEKPVEEADTKTFTLTVLDETGKPIPHAKILFGGAPAPLQSKEKQEFGEESYGMSNTETDKNGQYIARFPVKELKDIQCLFFWVDTPGYAPYNGFWERPEADPVPSEFSVKLEKGTTIGGVVQNTEGKPIAGASVTVYIPWEKRSRGETNSNIHFHEIITDENGLWKYESIPLTLADKPTGWTIAHVTHKDYMSLEDNSGNFSHFLADKNGEFKRVFTLPDGIPVKGRVTDESGKPIADALVVGHYRSTTDIVRLKTDEKGEFAFKNWPEHRGMGGNDSAYLAVRKPGFKTALESFDITREKPPTIDFVLKPVDKPIKIKIVDKEGKPVPNFMICIEQWKKSRLIAEDMLTGQEDQRGLTDEKGQWTWAEAPDDEVIFDILGRQYMSLRQVPLTARDEEYVFTVAPELKISGTVLDAVTNQPIPKFQVHFGFVWDEKHPLEFEPVPNVGGNGRYLINETYPRIYFQVKIEAEGYEPSISRKILSDEGAITVDFRLKKSTGN
jgi:uncharacterized GH25 family protein